MLITVVSVDPNVTKFGVNVLQSSQEQTQIYFLNAGMSIHSLPSSLLSSNDNDISSSYTCGHARI